MGAILLAVAMLQMPGPASFDPGDRISADNAVAASERPAPSATQTIHFIEIDGNRRIRRETILARIHSRVGEPVDRDQIESDVRSLAAAHWFDDIRAEILAPGPDFKGPHAEYVTLKFTVVERPWLAGVRFEGSKVFDDTRCKEILAGKHVELRTGEPLDRFAVWKASHELAESLRASGYPNAEVRVILERLGDTRSARLKFAITDGEKIHVDRVGFSGNAAIPSKKLRAEMEIDPAAKFSELRGKSFFTAAKLRADEEHLGEYYRDHGYPEARIGDGIIAVHIARKRTAIPWKQKQISRFEITIPVAEGKKFTFAAPVVHEDGGEADRAPRSTEIIAARLKAGEPYSEAKLTKIREALSGERYETAASGYRAPAVELTVDLNHQTHIATPTFSLAPRKNYALRRLEFTGQRKFTDRYYRRHIPLKEGDTFEPEKLHTALARLARTGYVKEVKPDDVRLQYDEWRQSVDVTIHVSETGQQKFSLIGGQSNLGSTAGIAYSLFNLLGGEELIDSQLEGGPDLLRIALTLSEESAFGTRASLAFSLFNYFVRPNLTSLMGNTHFLNTHSSGFGAGWGYPVAENESLVISYTDSHAATRYALDLPPELTGITGGPLTSASETVTHSIGATWEGRDAARHWQAATSISGAALGGNENLLRATAEYDTHARDPFSAGRNAWAIRGYAGAVASFEGTLPYKDRAFTGPELLRGFRAGEIAPYSEITVTDALGNSHTEAVSTGANLIEAVNVEYRVPISPRFAVNGFFDAGSGTLLPHWMGPDQPTLLSGTNRLLRASAGVELHWRAPVIEQPLRVNLSINVLRLAKAYALSDGSIFRAPDRRFALGWALGPRF